MPTDVPRLEHHLFALAEHVGSNAIAAMLYGSHARGDARADSDIDLLQLVENPTRPSSDRAVSTVAYTVDQLRAMVRSRSLFAWHLRAEGIVISDPHGILRAELAGHDGPVPSEILGRVRQLAAVLDVGACEFERRSARIIRIARYLLRTAVYARSLEAGERSFSIQRAVAAANAENFLPLVARAPLEPTLESLDLCRHALTALLGAPLARNPFGSLEALAVNMWDPDRQLAAIAVQAVAPELAELDYATLAVPLL